MLLNLSNHPSASWSKEQLQTAMKQYDAVTDMPFPQIAATATTDDVVLLTKKYLSDIKRMDPFVTVVHLMGEMTFVVALVTMLQRIGILVVCSTTERTVLEEKNGIKTAQFVFKQFRAYPKI